MGARGAGRAGGRVGALAGALAAAALALVLAGSAQASYVDGVKQLDVKNFHKWFDAAPRLTVVKFYAPWCGQCKALKDIYIDSATEMAESHPDFKMAEIDCNEKKNQPICDEFEIRSFPTMIYFLDGYPEDVFQGPRANTDDMKKEHLRVMKKIVPETKISKLETKEEYEALTKKHQKVMLAMLREPMKASKVWKAYQTAANMHAHNHKKDQRVFAVSTSKEVLAAIKEASGEKIKVPQLVAVSSGKPELSSLPRRQYSNYQSVGYWLGEA